MRLALVPVAALAFVAATAGSAFAATGGTGTVDTVLTGTTVAGTLSIAGSGASASLSGAPGTFTPATGVTALTVSDLTGTANGWAVTATYSAVTGTASLGGNNVEVSVSGVVPDALGGASAVTTLTDAPLTTPVTVASTTGTAAGSGITAMTASYKVRVPVTAKVGDVFGGRVTYTVASVR